ncbi:MAG: serine protein kinase RIO [Candidatus Bathyarchaeia archaeon]
MSDKIHEKLAHKEKTIERRDKMLIHDFSSERAAWEEVFDQSTLMVIYNMLNKGVLHELHGVVNAGKEARVYWGKNKEDKELAVKVYLTSSAEAIRGMRKYIEGDPRFKNVKHDTRSIIFTWAQKEFRNLQQASLAKIPVPKPIAVEKNVLVMEFIGKNGIRAPSLREQPMNNPEKVYSQLLDSLEKLYRKAELVHGDLSEYNIMLWKGKPLLFDLSQAVPTSHPMAQFLLRRDLTNINRFFSKLGVKTVPIDDTLKRVVG